MARVGHYRAYGPRKNIGSERLAAIRQADAILQEYESAGMVITLRQLYYQHVARGLIENTKQSYGRLGDLVADGRMAGEISWTAVEDRARGLQSYRYWESPHQAFQQARDTYRLNKWARQPWAPEVWSEKEGPLEGVCSELEVDFFVVHGYNSISEVWRAGQRFRKYISDGRTPIVIHLGDHDPSGLHMTEDNRRRLATFTGVNVLVHRIVLNMDQIERYRPPPQPAKETDSRYEAYAAEHGDLSWEMDALPPDAVVKLIRDSVAHVRDEKLWAEALEQENADRLWMADILEDAIGGGSGAAAAEDSDE